MGLRVTGAGRVARKLETVGKKATLAGSEEMIAGGELITELAKLQAPVDRANLEDAIKMLKESIGPLRAKVVVYVDERTPVPHRKNKTVGDYATRMHEGVYNLGERSQAKQSRNPGVIVGRKFLERAVDELEDEIKAAVEAAIKRTL